MKNNNDFLKTVYEAAYLVIAKDDFREGSNNSVLRVGTLYDAFIIAKNTIDENDKKALEVDILLTYRDRIDGEIVKKQIAKFVCFDGKAYDATSVYKYGEWSDPILTREIYDSWRKEMYHGELPKQLEHE